MKFLGLIFFPALIICTSGLQAQTATNAPEVNPAIQAAVHGAMVVRGRALFLIPPPADARASSGLAQTNALTQMGLNCRVYAAYLRRVDVSTCPDDFQAAWAGFINALENYRSADNLRSIVLVGEQADSALLVNPAAAVAADAKNTQDILGDNEIRVALQTLEMVCRKYGLDQIPAPK